MEMAIYFSFPLFLICLGVVTRFGKASFLIAGYNTLSQQEKAKYNEKALCRFVGNLLFTVAAIAIVTGVVSIFYHAYFAQIVQVGIVLICIAVIIAVIYMNTGNRFRR